MARKDFDEYYNKIVSQYYGLKNVLDEVTKEAESGMFSPDRLEQVKKTVEPVKASYHTLTYIKYLLDMPNRKSKRGRYKNQHNKMYDVTEGHRMDDIVNVNDKAINALKGDT